MKIHSLGLAAGEGITLPFELALNLTLIDDVVLELVEPLSRLDGVEQPLWPNNKLFRLFFRSGQIFLSFGAA